MPNTFAPFGFQQWYGGSGGVPTFAESYRRISPTSVTPVYSGDPLMNVITPVSGYVTQGVPGTNRLVGIFNGCEYIAVAEKRKVWSNYYPGSNAGADVICHVIEDPASVFVCQANGSAFAITGTPALALTAPTGQYAQFAIGTGNPASGRSGAYLASLGTTVTFPFMVRGLVGDPPGAPGTDAMSANNFVLVSFNNQWLRTNGAGPVGIS